MSPRNRNFRDLGGIAAGDEHVLRSGLVYRSEAPATLDGELRRVAPRVVIDLRTSAEREAAPSPPGEAEVVTIPGADGIVAPTSSEFAALLAEGPVAAAQTAMELYRRFPPVLAPAVAVIAGHIVAGHTPLLVHCAAGKDRTGFVCAALLHVAGAPWPAIEAEYLRSNHSFDAHRIAELMSTMTGEQLSAELAEPLLCRAEYLAGSFAVMRREAGSVDAYLATRAGVTAELRRRARAALLTPRG